MPGETEEIPETERDWGLQPAPPPPVPPQPVPPQPVSPQPVSPQPITAPAPVPPPDPRPPQVIAPPPVSAPVPRPVDAAGAFTVQFLGPSEFVEVFQRDILNGGLFVSTRYPGRLQEIVQIELHLPLPSVEPVVVRARVVQRFDPQGEGSLPNLLAGMGVELLDPAKVLADLRPIVASLTIA